jgi:hypothetical protein
MVSFSEIVGKLEPVVGKFSEFMVKEFKKALLEVFKAEAATDLKKAFLEQYDLLTEEERNQSGPAVRGKDPSSLERFRPLFEAQLERELQATSIKGDEIVINVGDKEAWGSGEDSPEGTPTSPDILSFYVEGIVGEFAFITPEQYESRGRRSSKPLGRFGGGFLISKERYKQELWHKVTGLSFEDVRHQISGQSPFKGFERVPNKIDFGKYIGIALEKTTKRFSAP